MKPDRSSSTAPIITAVLLLLLSGAYVGGYFWLANTAITLYGNGTTIVWRSYRSPWHWIFAPAARVEALIRGCRVNCQEYPV